MFSGRREETEGTLTEEEEQRLPMSRRQKEDTSKKFLDTDMCRQESGRPAEEVVDRIRAMK